MLNESGTDHLIAVEINSTQAKAVRRLNSFPLARLLFSRVLYNIPQVSEVYNYIQNNSFNDSPLLPVTSRRGTIHPTLPRSFRLSNDACLSDEPPFAVRLSVYRPPAPPVPRPSPARSSGRSVRL